MLKVSLSDIGSYLGSLVSFLLILTGLFGYINKKYTSESKTIKDLLDININAYLKGRDKSLIRFLINFYMYMAILIIVIYIVAFSISILAPYSLNFEVQQIIITFLILIAIVILISIFNKYIYKRNHLKWFALYKDTYNHRSYIVIKIIRDKMLVLSADYFIEKKDSKGNGWVKKSNIDQGKIISTYGNAYIKEVASLNYHPIKYVRNGLLP